MPIKATNGLFAGGGVIGCLIVPWLLNALGRRLTIQLISIVCVISAAIQVGSVHIAMFLMGRFINGVGVGMMDVSVPIYQSEISPASSRGRMVGSHGFLVVVGYVSSEYLSQDWVFLTQLINLGPRRMVWLWLLLHYRPSFTVAPMPCLPDNCPFAAFDWLPLDA